MTNFYEQQEKIQEEILARLQALEDQVFGQKVIASLTNTDALPVKPVAETVPVPGDQVGKYSDAHPGDGTTNATAKETDVHVRTGDAAHATQVEQSADRVRTGKMAQEQANHKE
jgi:hypothetical protein